MLTRGILSTISAIFLLSAVCSERNIKNTPYNNGEIIFLNKITGKKNKLILRHQKELILDNLIIRLDKCYKSSKRNFTMCISVFEKRLTDDLKVKYKGCFNSSDHCVKNFLDPVYELFPIRCF
jgi:hypothetical protein